MEGDTGIRQRMPGKAPGAAKADEKSQSAISKKATGYSSNVFEC